MQKKIKILIAEDESHQFAFYGPDHALLKQELGVVITVKDEELVHRVVRVVKLKIDEKFIVFDRGRYALVKLVSCLKHEIKVCVISCHENKILEPKISFLLPLLKKEALEEAIYSLAEVGINDVLLISTEKSRKSLTEKEMQRLQKIVISAAEQSKHYAFPLIFQIKSLQTCFLVPPV